MLKKSLLMVCLTLAFLIFAAPPANAKGNEYAAIVKHLKTKYRAKKIKIPMIWLARFAVSVVRPAGVKSFSVTLFEDLKFSRETLDEEMQTAMKNSFGEEWNSILRIRSREGSQVYMYMREAGKSVRIALVTIDKNQAAIIRATFSPEKLAEFVEDPKIFGISLSDSQGTRRSPEQNENPKDEKDATAEQLK